MAINRIAGQTLQSELVRDGESLAIQNTANSTPVLYMDVANSRIGINTDTPAVDFDVAGNLRASSANVGNLRIFGNTIVNIDTNGNVVLDPTGTGLAIISTTTGLQIPVGNTAQQPSPATAGTIRFNSDTAAVEVYDGSAWETVGSGTVTNQVIVPDGISNAYVLNQASTAASILVSINGLVQIPGVSYSYTVTGNTITFADVPLTTDIIDIRFL